MLRQGLSGCILSNCALEASRRRPMEPYYYPDTSVEFAKLATLGDAKTSITCSQFVAKEQFPNAMRIGTDSFEEAAQLLKDGAVSLMLVPGAYPSVAALLMDEDLMLYHVFKTAIPALTYGNLVNDILAPVETVYHHAAVTSLLPNVPGFSCGVKFVPVSSNEVAYEAMVRHGERAGCVSNQLVFDHFKRPSLLTLRTARDMAWLVFVARAKPKGQPAACFGEV
jgi:hypothetical protein